MNTRLFIDTNVMLDLLGERIPYYDSIAKIATLADKGIVTMIISETADLDHKVIEKGLASTFTDFEDSFQYQTTQIMERSKQSLS